MITAEELSFDSLLQIAIFELPQKFQDYLKTIAVIVEDEPSEQHWAELEAPEDGNEDEELFGLYVGTPLTDRSLTNAPLEPERIYLFRGPLLRLVDGDPELLAEEIRITLLHEIGHHFGMSEEDLERLGYQ